MLSVIKILKRQEIWDNTYQVFVIAKQGTSFCDRTFKVRYLLGETRCPIGHLLAKYQCARLDELKMPLREIWKLKDYELRRYGVDFLFEVFHRNDIRLLADLQVQYDLAAQEAHKISFHSRFALKLEEIRVKYGLMPFPQKRIASNRLVQHKDFS